VSQFLRETWELGCWALFSPSKLERRLQAWAPLEKRAAQDGSSGAEEPSEGEKIGVFSHVLELRTANRTAALRLTAQFTLISALLCAPLAVSILALGRPRDLALVIATVFGALGVGASCVSLGLLVPLLSALGYLALPGASQAMLDGALERLPHPAWLAAGIAVGSLLLGLTAATVEALWRRDRLRLGRMTLILGTVAALGAAALLATRSVEFAIAVCSLVGLGSLISIADENYRTRDTSDFCGFIAAGIFLILFFSFLTNTSELESSISVIALLTALMLTAFGGTRFIMRAFAHNGRMHVAEAIARAVLAGMLAGALTPLLSGPLVGLALSRAAPLLVASWLVGFGVAPTRAGAIRARDFARLLLNKGWFELRRFPTIAMGYRPTRWLLLGMLWPAALGFQGGIWALAIPAMLLGYHRVLPDYVVMSLVSLARAISMKDGAEPASVRWLRGMPPYAGELAVLPLPGHGRILVAALRVDPAAALEAIQSMMEPERRALAWTVIKADVEIERIVNDIPKIERSQLITGHLRKVVSLEGMARIAARADTSLLLLAPEVVASKETPVSEGDLPEVGRDVTELLPCLRDVARSAGESLEQELPVQRERDLERCLTELDRLRDSILSLDVDAGVASGWQSVVEQWQSVLRGAIDAQVSEALRKGIVQPFQSGNPIKPERAHLFKGRKQLAKDLMLRVLDQGRPTLVLHGPRRCGKSSFLMNLVHLLPDDLIPVYVDLQSQAMTSSEGDFCYGLLRAAARDLSRRGIEATAVERSSFQRTPYPALEDWLDGLAPRLGGRRLLLCLDEFEKLGAAIRRGTITASLLDELRHLIQHRDELSFILCGAQILDELGPSWSSYFINTHPMEVLYLQREEARELLTNPQPDFDLQYDAMIVDQVLDITRCQPYLVQLIGEAMVNVANRHHVRQIRQLMLEEAIAGALAAGEIYFTNLWQESTGADQLEVLAGQRLLQSLANGHSITTPDEVSRAALSRLMQYHVVEESAGYQIEIPLVARWVRERTSETKPTERSSASEREGAVERESR
jgi:hypothetical protein